MNNKGQISVGVLVVLFVGIIVALALFNPIANTVGEMSNKQVVTNQSNDISSVFVNGTLVNESIELTIYSQSEWKQQDCPLESVVLRNGAGTTLVLTTDYVLDADAGTYTLVNTANTQPDTSLNLTYADYSYCADGYNKDSGSRSILSIILVFAALIMLGFVLEKSGVIDLASVFGK